MEHQSPQNGQESSPPGSPPGSPQRSAPAGAAGRPQSRPHISAKFSPVGRVQQFLLPDGWLDPPPAAGTEVIVQTYDGPAMATVAPTLPSVVQERRPAPDPGQTMTRAATHDDVIRKLKQQQRERHAFGVGTMRIRERGLPMKLSRVEETFDGGRLIFYFTADSRIDFRELVRDLATEFRTRIEMRQIGVRDEARMLGGYGSCGRPLCCTTWLQSFEPVSIKMAKQQNLSLNPSKLSGLCGRLKCCLRYELPNGKGEQFAGCAHEGGCSGDGCAGDGACGTSGGGCGACGGRTS
jgi:cell fate regulator YaaT (PSP1 superfamily)